MNSRNPIPVAQPRLGEEEAAAAREAILSGWVTQGPAVEAFEKQFAEFVGAPHACAVANCTVALHLALQAVGVRPGDEVIVPSHSFIATANAIRYCGATPRFVDIDPVTFNIDPQSISAAVTSRTKVVLVVHQMGMPCDLRAIIAIAERHRLTVVEDAACAIGSEIRIDDRWERIGKPHGQVACFSFHPRKVMTTGEGGMLTTSDPELDRQFRLLRQHAMSLNDRVRHLTREVMFEQYDQIGFNYRMTDIQAAIGRVQLRRLPDMLERRRYLAERYRQALNGIPGLIPPQVPSYARPNYQSFPVLVTDDYALTRDQLMQALLNRGVGSRRGIMNAHQETPYLENAPPLPASELARDSVILLPIYDAMSESDQDYVVEQLERFAAVPI